MGKFTVHFVAQRAIGSPVNVNVKERNAAVSFSLHGELNVQVDREVPHSVGYVWGQKPIKRHVTLQTLLLRHIGCRPVNLPFQT
jgi:hypothetical protein